MILLDDGGGSPEDTFSLSELPGGSDFADLTPKAEGT
jgi:hypothetical protein